jgi:hypothetical protein
MAAVSECVILNDPNRTSFELHLNSERAVWLALGRRRQTPDGWFAYAYQTLAEGLFCQSRDADSRQG